MVNFHINANSMNCLCEVLGMALPGNGTIPAVYSERIRLAKHAGMKIMELLEKNIKPRDIITPDSIYNALRVDMALGCSTNSMLHLPAIAHEAKAPITLDPRPYWQIRIAERKIPVFVLVEEYCPILPDGLSLKIALVHG